MKKSFCILVILVTSCCIVNAQNVRIGFTAGVAVANFTGKLDGETDKGKSIAGVTAGMLVDIPAGSHFSFQPAVNFVQKGTKDEGDLGGSTLQVKMTVNSFEIPLNFLYNTHGSAGNFFVGAGPSVAFAISGRATVSDGTNSASQSLKFGNGDDDNLRGLDIGANILAGYSFSNGLSLSANYNKGLNNLLPQGSSDGTMKSSYFGIKLGYMMSPKGKK